MDRDYLPDTRAPFTPEEREHLLAYLLRHPTLFLEARQELQPLHFGGGSEEVYAAAWTAALKYYTQGGQLPTPDVLLTETAVVLRNSGTMPAPMVSQALGQLRPLFEMDVQVLLDNTTYGRELLYRFLVERLVAEPLQAVAARSGGRVLTDPQAVFQALAGVHSRLQALRSSVGSVLYPQGWTLEMGDERPMGIPWLDRMLEGGVSSGQVYGLLGPSGAFKTGAMIQLAVSLSKREASSPKPGLVVYAVYEGGEDAIRLRALGHAARVRRSVLKGYLLGRGALSTSRDPASLKIGSASAQSIDDLVACGLRRGHQDLSLVTGEAERLEVAVEATRNFRILDLSGSRRHPHAGRGYVPELSAAVDRLRRETGQEIAAVLIDYAKLMAKRHVQAKGIRLENLRHFVGSLGDLAREELAEKYRCPVWIAQQLNTAANRKAPGAAQHHADSSEAGDFAENLWYAFTISQIDKGHGNSVQFRATKTRDAEDTHPPIVLSIDAVLQELTPTDRYVINPNSGRLIPAGAAEGHVAAPTGATGPTTALPGSVYDDGEIV